MEKAIITNDAVQIKGDRVGKTGRKLKAVFGRWDGEALVTEAGRLASRKDLGAVTGKSKGELTQAYTNSVARFNLVGEAFIAKEQSEVASGRREMARMFHNPKTGRTIIETTTANKAVKVSKILEEQGIDSEIVEKILAALKIA